MPMEDMLALDTCEIRSSEWTAGYLEYKRDEQYEDVKKSIIEHGFQPGFAPEIVDGIVVEGHHRITAMYELSVWCPWQEHENVDQYENNWEHYVYPRELVEANA
jgi:hypothetical protein